MNTPAMIIDFEATDVSKEADRIHPTVYGIGYLGIGNFVGYVNNEQTKEYRHWFSMMTRCYSSVFHSKNPTYKGCSVCVEWHDFQNFANWLVLQPYHNHDYHLDKDILKRGNKIYSPQHCCLVPIEINSMLTNSKAIRGDYPVGVSFHKGTGKFQSRMSVDKKSIYLGIFDNPQEAHNAYVKAKTKHVADKANEWRDRIDTRVYDAMLNWDFSYE